MLFLVPFFGTFPRLEALFPSSSSSLFGEGFFPLGFLLCLRFTEISCTWVPDQAFVAGTHLLSVVLSRFLASPKVYLKGGC